MTALLILGCGGHAKVVAETALAVGRFTRIAFVDDRCSSPGDLTPVLGWPVLGHLAHALEPSLRNQFVAAVVAIGHAATRLHWQQQLLAAGYELPVLIHPSAWVSPSAQIGPGSVLLAQVVVQAHVRIGAGAILNTSCSVDHDVQLADGVHVCPGARLAGEVQVGESSWIGIGASLIQQIRIGCDVTIGAGAAVISDLPDGVTAFGVPARVLPRA